MYIFSDPFVCEFLICISIMGWTVREATVTERHGGANSDSHYQSVSLTVEYVYDDGSCCWWDVWGGITISGGWVREGEGKERSERGCWGKNSVAAIAEVVVSDGWVSRHCHRWQRERSGCGGRGGGGRRRRCRGEETEMVRGRLEEGMFFLFFKKKSSIGKSMVKLHLFRKKFLSSWFLLHGCLFHWVDTLEWRL